jgi:hypothetical protein
MLTRRPALAFGYPALLGLGAGLLVERVLAGFPAEMATAAAVFFAFALVSVPAVYHLWARSVLGRFEVSARQSELVVGEDALHFRVGEDEAWARLPYGAVEAWMEDRQVFVLVSEAAVPILVPKAAFEQDEQGPRRLRERLGEVRPRWRARRGLRIALGVLAYVIGQAAPQLLG